jgi:hypothetical protein
MIVLRRMSSDQPAPRRPRHTAEMIAQRIRARRPWRRAIAAIVLVATLVVMSTMSVATPRSGADAPRLVLLGDVRTTDPTLGLAISEALRAALHAAPDVNVLGDARARETVRLMGQPDTARLIGPLAIDVAQRLSVALVVTASIVPLGGGAQIVTQVIDVSSGIALATITERPASPGDIAPAMARVASKLRERVSGARVPDSVPPFPAVTTSPGPPVLARGIWRVWRTESELLSATLIGPGKAETSAAFCCSHR